MQELQLFSGTGQAGAEQVRLSVEGLGQGLPPFARFIVTLNVRVCVPFVPHAVAEHELQSDQ